MEKILKVSYSNSKKDAGYVIDKEDDEYAVRGMYEQSPYPDLGADLKDFNFYLDPIHEETKKISNLKFLDVGCGTGHVLVSVANKKPEWDCYGIDLSDASLNIAQKLVQLHGVGNVTIKRGSYLDDLPFGVEPFHVISAMGTIHHTADPLRAMQNLNRYLSKDGYLLLHLYGWRVDRGKFDVKQMLSVFEPDLKNHEKRFELYSQLVSHRKKRWLYNIAQMSLVDIYHKIKYGVYNLKRKSRKVSWSPGWEADYPIINSPWIDHFCHPCERAYEVPEVKELVEESGFKVVKMLKQGRPNFRYMPEAWRSNYNKLDDWSKWHLNELLAGSSGGSFAMILQKV